MDPLNVVPTWVLILSLMICSFFFIICVMCTIQTIRFEIIGPNHCSLWIRFEPQIDYLPIPTKEWFWRCASGMRRFRYNGSVAGSACEAISQAVSCSHCPEGTRAGESQATFEQITQVWLPRGKIFSNNISVAVLEHVTDLEWQSAIPSVHTQLGPLRHCHAVACIHRLRSFYRST